MAIYVVNKELGETPLGCLRRIKVEKGIPDNVSATYAGRLDPAAEGKMMIITGDDIKDKDSFLNKEKIYEVEYVFGFKTDTGDMLGVLEKVEEVPELDQEKLKQALQSLSGERSQRFHKFSSKVVSGKPLWQHARDGGDFNAEHIINIFRIDVLESQIISAIDVYIRVLKVAGLTSGDFRQKDIISSWDDVKTKKMVVPIIKIQTHVSSGTYMRVLGEEIGEKMGLPVSAYSITRKEFLP